MRIPRSHLEIRLLGTDAVLREILRRPFHPQPLNRSSAGAFLEPQKLPLPAQSLAETATVGFEQLGYFAGRRLATPVTLQLADVGPGRHWNGAGLNHALHRHVMGFAAGAALGVADEVHLVAIVQRRKDGHLQADLGP
jgi:hypothetical protein